MKLMFSKAVDVSGTPRVKIDLDPEDGGEKWAEYDNGSGTKKLEFAYTVMEGDISTAGVAVLENTLALNGGTIRSASATDVGNARLAHGGVKHDPGHRVVTPGSAAPILQSLSVTGATLTITFSEALGAASSLSNDAFMVKKTPQDGDEETVSLSGAPAISGSTLTLTLASAVLDTDAGIKVSYAKPSTGANNKLIDAVGREIASFTDEPVTNTGDTTKPTLVRGEIDGDVITLYFSEPLDEKSGGKGDRYRISLQWGTKSYGNPPHHRQCYYKNKVSFIATPREVYVTGNTVTVVGLIESPEGRVGVGQPVYYVQYSVNLNTAAVERLRDYSGNAVSTPNRNRTRFVGTDNVTQLPYPKTATVVGNRLTMNFSAPMDGGSEPASSVFTVKVRGSAVSLSGSYPVAISGNTVTLTLASAVASADTVTVSYAKPSNKPLQNVICEDAPSFTDQAVTNSTP